MKAALLTTWRRMPLLTPLQQVSTHRPLYSHVGILEATKATANTCCTPLAHQRHGQVDRPEKTPRRCVRGSCPTRVSACAWSAYLQCFLVVRLNPLDMQATREHNKGSLPAYYYNALFAQTAARSSMPLRSWPTKCSGSIALSSSASRRWRPLPLGCGPSPA
jgi:hypothetical protein